MHLISVVVVSEGEFPECYHVVADALSDTEAWSGAMVDPEDVPDCLLDAFRVVPPLQEYDCLAQAAADVPELREYEPGMTPIESVHTIYIDM